ncbi:MAG: HAMP domain-containing sensor histidine kinase [Propioniciclava sp.]|uniref:sensor histidine kinase n=1 Tax=Propioniciclava sp. TaxID=2038686 RepID=UPI0039E67448
MGGQGTLSRQLVLRVTALVAAVAIALSALTALAVNQILTDQLDQQLRSTGQRLRDPGTRGPLKPAGDPGQIQGLLRYIPDIGGIIQEGRDYTALTVEQTAPLDELTTTGPLTVHLPGVGSYRVQVISVGGTAMAIGLPTASLTATMLSLLLAATALTLTTIVAAFWAARAVVERSLRPLAQLAETARTVSALDLHSGEVAVPVRVPDSGLAPTNEVAQVGAALNVMLDNVEGALAARQHSETKLRQFVADASHELRNPLASIRGYAELTRRERADVPETTAHALGRIESESERMSGLVNDLLLLARLDSGPTLQARPVSMGALLANAVSDAEAAGPGHRWELTLPDEEVLALGDESRVQQIVANLLGNARTHTPAGTLVQTALAREGAWAVVTVTDNGPGIPENIRDRVFERFMRADTSRVRTGSGQSTGLGLAIVAAVVGAHGGQVGVESRPGFTRFTVRLPLVR